MIPRYEDPRNEENWSLATKFMRWQNVELAVIESREDLGRIAALTHRKTQSALLAHPIDVGLIIKLEETELGHDLAAFLKERRQWIPDDLQCHFHDKGMTSFDDEDPAMVIALRCGCEYVFEDVHELLNTTKSLALKYRFAAKYERTHGQGAELQSFGRCCITWYQDLIAAKTTLEWATKGLEFSKLSGMIGSNSSMDPEIERAALAKLGLKPWAGATQIMSRIFFTPVSDALASIASVIEKNSFDIWLGSRSGRPLWHEPFGKMQKGSSANPGKKNPIVEEQNRGMGNMARSDAACLKNTIVTAEGRDISQSCVERVKWPDIFAETLRCIKNQKKVLSRLNVFLDNMLIEIAESRGTYAASTAKDFLAEAGLQFGLTQEDAYRIVQVACHNAYEPSPEIKALRECIPTSPAEMDAMLEKAMELKICFKDLPHIRDIIAEAKVSVSQSLDFDQAKIESWNKILNQIFSPETPENLRGWSQLFLPSYICRNENSQFEEVFSK